MGGCTAGEKQQEDVEQHEKEELEQSENLENLVVECEALEHLEREAETEPAAL